MAHVLAGEGVLIVGTFDRVEKDDKGFCSCILTHPKYDGSTFERRVLFDDFDRETGDQTQISADLALLSQGQRVALFVKYQASKAGNAYARAHAAEPMVEVTLTDEGASAGRSRSTNGSK